MTLLFNSWLISAYCVWTSAKIACKSQEMQTSMIYRAAEARALAAGSRCRRRWWKISAVTAVFYITVCNCPTPVTANRGDNNAPAAQALLGQQLAYRNRIKELWKLNIAREMRAHYCETATGEEIGWLISPILNGLYYGYLATADTRWIDGLISCANDWVRRAVVEPDGYPGWPKVGAAGTPVDDLDSYYADSLLGEAMALRPVVLLSSLITKDTTLRNRYGSQAAGYIRLAGSIFRKWQDRGAWRPVAAGYISIVLPFGIDRATGRWTNGYANRNSPTIGFSHPDNKANLVASWLLAMFDATGNPEYRTLADNWFRVMKSRMVAADDGTYRIWNYWEPAGAWDYNAAGRPKHWIGVHPNPGYYDIDVTAIVAAYAHGLEFSHDDIDRLVRTDAGQTTVWPALVPYDPGIRQRFEQTLDPSSWAGLTLAPWYLALLEHPLR
ncbi:hypothetical protein [Rhodopila globiformis]|nr:hypothetical protein [Rhodopila globiformis]